MTDLLTPRDGGRLSLVTIVTPTYNREGYLGATIESVLAQTYPHVEYIIVDDGSTDCTRDLCARYEGRLVYAYQENAGQSAAINVGWSRAKGKYLMYLSSDDLLKPDAVARLVQVAEQCGKEVIVYPDFDVIDADGHWLYDMILGPFDVKDFLVGLHCMIGPGALFSKSLFDRYGGWRTSLRKIPDYEYWLRLSASATLMNLSMVLATSRCHQGAISYSKVDKKRSLEIVRVTKIYVLPKIPGRESEMLVKAYTTSLRYFMRSGQFRHVGGLLRRIWAIRKRHLATYSFLKSFAGELWLFSTRRLLGR